MKYFYVFILLFLFNGIVFSMSDEYSTIDILYESDSDIYGFQFDVSGVNVISAFGGISEDMGFSIFSGNNTVLGFSVSGAYIPAGEGVFIILEIEGDLSSACLENLLFSGANGVSFEVEIVDCLTLSNELPCGLDGDMNGDGGWNVLDIVALANCILGNDCDELENGCAGDMNGDEGWNVLDVVALANCVLAANCADN